MNIIKKNYLRLFLGDRPTGTTDSARENSFSTF